MPVLNKACELATVVLATPIGHVTVTGCDIGIHKITLTAAKILPTHQTVKNCEVYKEPVCWKASVRVCCDWLEEYFSDIKLITGKPLPPLHVTDFKPDSFSCSVWQKLASDVRPGQTVTYGQLASLMGNPHGARAVGGAMRRNPTPLVVPCHRVVAHGGKLGGFTSDKGCALKAWLLQHEGVKL